MSEKSKKVLFVATVVKTHIMQFHIPYLKMFKEMGYETVVAARNDYENPEDCRIPYCDHYIDVPFERNPFCYENLRCYKKLKSIMDEGEFSIIHCHTPVGGVVGRLAAKKARKKGTRVIYTAHGFHFYKGAPIKNWLLYYPAEKLCARFTDVLITINKEDYDLAQKKMKAKCVKYLPGVGVDFKKFSQPTVGKAAKRRELGIPEDGAVLLSVGELNSNKNHETVIRAIADMDVYYIIAGNGGLQQHLQNVIDTLDVCDRVKLLGYRCDAKELYEAADIFVFPSFREGLPVALMEAMAAGVPVVASQIRGNVDLIQDGINGFLCDPSDAHSFADRTRMLLTNDALANSFSERGKEKIKKYDIENVLRGAQEIYNND